MGTPGPPQRDDAVHRDLHQQIPQVEGIKQVGVRDDGRRPAGAFKFHTCARDPRYRRRAPPTLCAPVSRVRAMPTRRPAGCACGCRRGGRQQAGIHPPPHERTGHPQDAGGFLGRDLGVFGKHRDGIRRGKLVEQIGEGRQGAGGKGERLLGPVVAHEPNIRLRRRAQGRRPTRARPAVQLGSRNTGPETVRGC